MPYPPLPRLVTERLVVRPGIATDVPAIVSYYLCNRAHLRPVDPRRPESFYGEDFWHARLRQDHLEIRDDRSLRLFLFRRGEDDRVIGVANFTQFMRGAAHYCTLGYAIDQAEEGKGLMREALSAAIEHIFQEKNLHRVQANYMPRNERSGALLKRLGFTIEGLARDYLLIDGRWEDHVLTSLTNPGWKQPS
jgi:ribosomal-protein-alanine N-acetyltransferase